MNVKINPYTFTLHSIDTLYGSKNLHKRDMAACMVVKAEDHIFDCWELVTFGGVHVVR